jgi:Tfp pilus assembly pilus retraction ATPase PilT
MQNEHASRIAHVLSHVIINAQKLGANEVWLRSQLAPVCKVEGEVRSVYERTLSRDEVNTIYRVLWGVAHSESPRAETSAYFDVSLT